MDLLPEEIIPTVLCYAICRGQEGEALDVHESVDIAICNANGYLLEFCNKRIINSCYIQIEDASNLHVYYQFTGDKYIIYYLVKNESGVMVVIKKYKETLIVMGCYNNVRNWKVFDFKNKGHPQLGVYYFNSDTVSILNLTEFDSFKLGVDNHFTDEKSINNSRNLSLLSSEEEEDLKELLGATNEELPPQNHNASIVDFLTSKLQAMELVINEGKYEEYEMNETLRLNFTNKKEISDQLRNAIQVTFTTSWCRIHLSHWIIGVEFWTSGIRDTEKLKIIAVGRDFTSYTHRVFRLSDEADPDVEEGGRGNQDDHFAETNPRKCIAVVALRVPDFGQRTSLATAFTFIHDGYQFHTGSFHLKPDHFFQEKYQLFRAKNEISLSEDLMTCLTVRREVGLTVAVKYNLGITVEEVLTGRLGFTKVEMMGENYFIKETGDLTGTCVSCKRMWVDLTWTLRIFVTDYTILRIFVGVLHNELPLPVNIRLD